MFVLGCVKDRLRDKIDGLLAGHTRDGTRSRTLQFPRSNLCYELCFPCSALCVQDKARLAWYQAPLEMAPPPGHVPPPQLTVSHVDPRLRVTKYVVTPWTASKIALASFAVGVLVGYRLNKTIRRLAARLLHSIQKDD